MLNPNTVTVETLRNASIPFTLTMNELPFMLMEEELKNQVELPLQRKLTWSSHTLSFQSLQSNTLKMLNEDRNSKYVMTIEIEPNKVHVACSCGMNVKTLCVHSYKAIEYTMRFNGFCSFRKYKPLGLFDIASKHPECFEKEIILRDTYFKPKDSLGNVYQLTEKPAGLEFDDLIGLAGSSSATKIPPTMALTYVIMAGFRRRHLPSVLPCLGNLTKDGKTVKTFNTFISATQKQFQDLLTDDQRTLNDLSLEIWQLAKKQSGSLIGRLQEQIPALVELFGQWQKIWPLLVEQEFVFLYHFYDKNFLKRKPRKQYLWPVKLRNEKVCLQFELKEKEAFFELHLKIMVNAKPLPKVETETSFLVKEGQNVYLLSSARDAGMIEWMYTRRGHLTIFKEHFAEFEKECLNPLREFYPVKEIKSAGRKSHS